MAHFCKIGKGSIVEKVEATTEQDGIDFLNNLYGTNDIWRQTSYNTKGGEHLTGGTPFRKNYAGIGYKYDQIRDAFIPPKLFDSWKLNETTCLWEAPIDKPDDGQDYDWNETNQTWDLKT